MSLSIWGRAMILDIKTWFAGGCMIKLTELKCQWINNVMMINTSSKGKQQELARLFRGYGKSVGFTEMDLPEIDSDCYQVVAHKASQVPRGVVVEDTSLDVEGESVGVHIKHLLARLVDHLKGSDDLIGRRAIWRVLLAQASEQGDEVMIFQGEVHGKLSLPFCHTTLSSDAKGGRGPFDPYFSPEGLNCTLSYHKPDSHSARAMAVDAFMHRRVFKAMSRIDHWEGRWQ